MSTADSSAPSAAGPATPPPAGRGRGRPRSVDRETVLAAALDLLRERGASRLTTKEVAARAGVSEGSVFHHFTDRAGLLTAVIEDAVDTLTGPRAGSTGSNEDNGDGDLRAVLDWFTAQIEGFLDRALVAMIAAQSDAVLRTALADHLQANDMGPHRGIGTLAGVLRGRQRAGEARADVDADAVAQFVYSACFERVSQRVMIGPGYGADLPDRQRLVTTMATLLRP